MSKFQTLLAYLVARAKEPTTWRGIIAIASLAGMNVASFDLDASVAVAFLLDGALKILIPEAVKQAATLQDQPKE